MNRTFTTLIFFSISLNLTGCVNWQLDPQERSDVTLAIDLKEAENAAEFVGKAPDYVGFRSPNLSTTIETATGYQENFSEKDVDTSRGPRVDWSAGVVGGFGNRRVVDQTVVYKRRNTNYTRVDFTGTVKSHEERAAEQRAKQIKQDAADSARDHELAETQLTIERQRAEIAEMLRKAEVLRRENNQ